MGLTESEFIALRRTIASRGTARIILLPVTLIAWSALTCTLLFVSDLPIASLFSLAILVGGFEAIHALHVGVERIGRYVQVYYESSENGPQWETTAMAIGPALPGGGVDPLFTIVFAASALINVIPALLPAPAGCRTRKLSSHQIRTLNRKIVIIGHPFEPTVANSVTNL